MSNQQELDRQGQQNTEHRYSAYPFLQNGFIPDLNAETYAKILSDLFQSDQEA